VIAARLLTANEGIMEDRTALEVAESEFERWAKAMDLARKLDPIGLDSEDKKALSENKRVILDAIQSGNLVVTEEGEFVYTPKIGDEKTPIRFFEPDGAVFMAIDRIGKSGEQEVKKSYAMLAAMTKEAIGRFSKMKNRDLTVCNAVLLLFLAK
jgi:hypothetical protein